MFQRHKQPQATPRISTLHICTQLCPEGQFVLSVSTVVEANTPLRELDDAFELLDDPDIVRSPCGGDGGRGRTCSDDE